MATSTYGTPYVESGDLVSNWPTTSQSVADRVDDVSIKGNGVNTQTGTTYTTVLTDAGKTVTLDNAAAVAVTIPPNASVAYETGTQIKFLNLGAGTVTLGPGSGVTLNGDTLTADQYIGLAAIKVDTDEWVVLPFSGGVGSAQISNTPTGSYSGYEYWRYTASGTLTVSKAGFADILLVGGGGAGGYNAGGGGGAGGMVVATDVYLPVGNLTVSIGAGGGASGSGAPTRFGYYYSPGGGRGGTGNGAYGNQNGSAGGSGGGGGSYNGAVTTGGAGGSGIGNGGGNATSSAGNFAAGGGGGAGGSGASATGSTGGAGGAGLANSYTGSSVTYAAGGTGKLTASGAANTGNGGGGNVGTGGSGIVVVRVTV
jgi:hypothetical protein